VSNISYKINKIFFNGSASLWKKTKEEEKVNHLLQAFAHTYNVIVFIILQTSSDASEIAPS
jgi:hypothetical protein